jgi:hypothetical protein
VNLGHRLSQKANCFRDNTLDFFLSQFHGWHAFETVISSSRLRNQNLIPAKSVRLPRRIGEIMQHVALFLLWKVQDYATYAAPGRQ